MSIRRSGCKSVKCTVPGKHIEQGGLRIGKSFKRSDDVVIVNWYHPHCFIFDVAKAARTWRLADAEQLEGFHELDGSEQADIKRMIGEAALVAGPSAKHAGALGSGSSTGRQLTLFGFMPGGANLAAAASAKLPEKTGTPGRAGTCRHSSGGGARSSPGDGHSAAPSAGRQGKPGTGASAAHADAGHTPKFEAWCTLMERLATTPSLLDKQALIRESLTSLPTSNDVYLFLKASGSVCVGDHSALHGDAHSKRKTEWHLVFLLFFSHQRILFTNAA